MYFYRVISLVTSNNPLLLHMCVLESISLRQKGWNLLHRFLSLLFLLYHCNYIYSVSITTYVLVFYRVISLIPSSTH